MAQTATCPVCGERFRIHSGGHCIGGKWGGCCRTFSSDASGDAHRVGTFAPDTRHCLDVPNLDGWRRNTWGEWTNAPPMPLEAVKRRQGIGSS